MVGKKEKSLKWICLNDLHGDKEWRVKNSLGLLIISENTNKKVKRKQQKIKTETGGWGKAMSVDDVINYVVECHIFIPHV